MQDGCKSLPSSLASNWGWAWVCRADEVAVFMFAMVKSDRLSIKVMFRSHDVLKMDLV